MSPGLNARQTDRMPQVSVQPRWRGPSFRIVEVLPYPYLNPFAAVSADVIRLP